MADNEEIEDIETPAEDAGIVDQDEVAVALTKDKENEAVEAEDAEAAEDAEDAEKSTGDPLVVTVRTAEGEKTDRQINLDPAYFGVRPNIPLMHQVVTAQLAGIRRGTQSTKTRAEVRGGGAKPYRQKGTGRARQGSIRAPQHTGGGVALGPKPRSYAQRTPKKMVRAALRSALSDRALERKVMVLESWGIDEPSTKRARKALDALDLRGTVCVVLGRDDVNVWKSFRNLIGVNPLLDAELNCYDILKHDWVVFTEATLPGAGGQDGNGEST